MRNIETKLFIHVPFSFRKTLKPFSKFVLYTTYSPEKTLGYAFLQHTEAYREFSETLTRMQIPFTVFREETIYSPEDYEQAPFMRLHIEHEIDQVLPVVERHTCPFLRRHGDPPREHLYTFYAHSERGACLFHIYV